jgi:hypothetical protein
MIMPLKVEPYKFISKQLFIISTILLYIKKGELKKEV